MSVKKKCIRFILSRLFGKSFSSIDEKMIQNSQIISLDVFDTMIFRANYKNRCIEMERYNRKRDEAELIARKKKQYEEITLHDIYRCMYPEDEKKQLKGEEDEVLQELKQCYANNEALEFFEHIKHSGKQVIVVSDMYLPKNAISLILANAGYNLEDVNIYVSSEFRLTKKSGNLFREIINIEGTNNILHIGDNLISDYVVPKRMGIKSILYKKMKN